MLLLIRYRVRLDPGLNQGQGHVGILHGMPVLAVVEQRYPVMPLGKIHPLLSAALKPGHIPAGVLVGLPGQVSELHIKRSLVRVYSHGKMYLQKRLVLLPVHTGCELNSPALRIKDNLLIDHGIGCLPRDGENCPHRAKLRPLHPLHLVHIPELFRVKDINIPVVIVNRFVLIHPKKIGPVPLLYHLTLILLIIDTGKHSLFIQLYTVKRSFQPVIACQIEGNTFRITVGGNGCRIHHGKGLIAL